MPASTSPRASHRRPRAPGGRLLVASLAALLTVAGCTGSSHHHSTSSTAGRGRSLLPTGDALVAQADQPLTREPARHALNAGQVSFLEELARRTWRFFGDDLDPTTHLPRNNIARSGATARSDFTSPTEIGLFLAALVAAQDLHLDTPANLRALAAAELTSLRRLQTYHGFPLRWYRASTGQAIGGPSGRPLGDPFVSTVDDAWYALGLVLARAAFPILHDGYSRLLSAMDFGLLYDHQANQLYTGYQVARRAAASGTDDAGQPSSGDYELLYGGTRVADYLAIGTRTVPGRLWWGVRLVPTTAQQRQRPITSQRATMDPQSGQPETRTQGYYTFAGIKFVPTFAGSMFQALAPALAAPELSQSPTALGLNDRNTVLAQIAYAASLHLPVWGFAPASTPRRLNGYAQYGADALATKTGVIPHDAVTPYAAALALPFEPALAAQNLTTLATRYPDAYTGRGFLDSIDPRTGRAAQRYMAVSQAAILTSIANTLDGGAVNHYFADDPVGQTLAPYLRAESFPIR